MKMHVIIFLQLLFLWKQEFAESVRILDLQVSTHAAEGGEALLGCQFDMEGEVLYSVKWYKDGREFFRYVPRNIPPNKSFITPGVIVDMTRSSSNIVTLVQLDRESAGLYRCQVTGEYPNFPSVSLEKHISVYLLPEEGPQITGLQNRYGIGDEVKLNCTSAPSRPEAELKWVLNGHSAPAEYVHGPWYKISTNHIEAGLKKKHKGFRNKLDSDPNIHSSAPLQSKLKLIFRVMPEHFVEGVLTIKNQSQALHVVPSASSEQGSVKRECQATIAPLYQQETNFTYHLEIPATTVDSLTDTTDSADKASLLNTSLFLTLIIIFRC